MFKNYISKFRTNAVRFGVVALMFGGVGLLKAQLSGTYTLGSGGDYATWQDLASDISSVGVSGPVTVNVISDLTQSSTTMFKQNATYPTTSTNTITINGNGYKLGSSYAYAAIELYGMDYLTIKKLTIQLTSGGTSQKGILFWQEADYNTVDSCTIEYTSLTSGTTSSAGGAYIVFSWSTTSNTTYNTSYYCGTNNTISNCLMRTTNSNSPGPTYAVVLMGSSGKYSSTPSNNTLKNNTIQNYYYYGIFNYYNNGNQILNNDISRDNSSSFNCYSVNYVMYNYQNYCTNRSTKIEGNRIHDLPYKNATSGYTSTFYGMYNYYGYGNSSNYYTIKDNTFENIVCNSTNYYSYGYYNYYSKYDGNTIDNWQSLGSSSYHYGWYMYYHYSDHIFTNNTIKNCFTKYYTYFSYCYYGDRKEFRNNTIKNNVTADGSTGYTYGFYMYYPNSSQTHYFENNTVDSNTFGSYTYVTYLYYFNGLCNKNRITNNKIYNANYSSYYGYIYSIYNYYFFNLQCNNNLVAGNVGYYGVMGLYCYSSNSGSYNAEFKQNTIQQEGQNAGYQYHYTYALYCYPYYHQKINTIGNIVDIQNSYGAYPAYTYNTNGVSAYNWDYNNYYLKNISYQYWYCPNGSASDLSSWQNLGFAGNNETGHLPVYKDVSKTDYRVDVFELQNKVPQIAALWPTTPQYNLEDNGNNPRNPVKTDHGAMENEMNITATKTDFKVADTVCSGHIASSNIYVKNNFVDTIYNFNVSYGTSGGGKVTQNVTDKILPGDSLKIEFTNPISLDKVGDLQVEIYVDAADDNLMDDTLYFSTYVKPAPGGSKWTASSKSTAAVYQYGKPNDVTVINQPVYYEINSPTKFNNAGYGKTGGDWYAEAQAYTAGGTAINGASVTDPATTGGDMEVKFETADATLEDSMITIVLRVIDNLNGCDTFIRRNVLIYPSITPLFTDPSPVCEGEAVLFENKSTVLSGSMEFMWDFGTGNSADNTEAPEPVFQFPGKGNFDVTLTAKTVPYGFTFSKKVTISVNPIPTVAFTKVNACEGDAIVFTNTTSPSTADMSWDFGDGSKSTTLNPTKKYNTPGSYFVTLKADLNGCVATMSQKVYQFDRPVAEFAVTSGTCDNDVFEFQNNTTMGGGLFGSFWDFDDNGSVSTDVDAMYDFMSSGDKNVSLVVTSEFGCKDTIVKTVSIKESPKVGFTNGPLCSVKPTDFVNTTPDVANTFASYEWNFGDGTTSGAKSPTHNWAGKLGPKKVSLKITLDNGCSEMLEKDLVVLTQPTPNFAAEDVCSGDDVIFVNNTTWAQGEINYVWDFGDGTNSNNSDPVKQYITSVTLTPKVTLYAYIDGGCADSITKEIVINETPRTCDFVAEADYGYGFYGMKVEPVNQSGVVGGQDEVDYVWVFEGGGTKKTSGQDAAAYNDFATDGEHRVTMRATMQQTGCECSITKNVVMNRSNAQELLNDGVSVYPNPASGVFTVATTEVFGKNVTIEVRTMSGQIVKVMENVGTSMVQVDASAMSNGMYLVKVSNGEKEITRKLHIQN